VWSKRVVGRHGEDDNNSLDRRLMEAREEAMRLERMFAENKQTVERQPHYVKEPIIMRD
jgi:hypothetical protein